MSRLGAVLAAAFTLLAVAGSADGQDPTALRNADILRVKISAIAERGDEVTAVRAPARTTVSEPELNGYLAVEVAEELPAGVVSPSVSMLGGGRAIGRATVDLDRVRRAMGATSALNPISYLRGQLPVVATGTLRTTDGIARLQFESATVGGVRVPKLVLQQIVSHYSKSDRFPSGISLDDPFRLPARIREIQVERGLAIVIQ
jgi:hypothetical protein